MDSLTDRFINRLIQVTSVDDLSIIKIRYAIAALKSEVIKTIILIVIFYMLDLLVPFLFTMLLIIPIRIFSGGLHIDNNLYCFLTSLCFFLLSVMILPQIQLQNIVFNLILIISASFIMILPLAPSSKRPIISSDKYLLNKYLSISFTLVYVFLILFLLDNQYLIKCGIWALSLQSLQLFILTLKRFRR